MSLIIGWKKRANVGLALVLFGLAGIAQGFVVYHAQTVLGVTSVYLLTLVPLGASLAFGGVEMSLVEAVHMRFAMRERKSSKWKKADHRGLRPMIGRLEVASILSAFFVLLLSLAFYISVVAACQGTDISYYARFALAEVSSALIMIMIGFIIERILRGKSHTLFNP
jgi:hypothetical protein